MENLNRKAHWDKIYRTSNFNEVSWYQARPDISLGFVQEFRLPKNAKIIDIGGGDSNFVDYLLAEGYEDVTVLDISESALTKVKKRLRKKANRVKWMVADASQFKPTEMYDFWHDRAAFHFLNEEDEISRYIENVRRNINPGGYLVLGTFSTSGPENCSGLPVRRYSEMEMKERLKRFFEKIKCLTINHLTPSNKVQNFIFCSFRRVNFG